LEDKKIITLKSELRNLINKFKNLKLLPSIVDEEIGEEKRSEKRGSLNFICNRLVTTKDISSIRPTTGRHMQLVTPSPRMKQKLFAFKKPIEFSI